MQSSFPAIAPGGDSRLWRVLADSAQQMPKIDDAFPVELQASNRGAADGRQPKNQCEVIAPHEVFVPEVLTRMIEVSQCASYRVAGTATGELAAVTAHAGKGQVIELVRATGSASINVVDGKRVR